MSTTTHYSIYLYNMIKHLTILLSLSVVALLSCNSSDSSDNTDQTQTTTAAENSEDSGLPNGLKNLTEAEKRGMRLLKRRQEAKNNDSRATENNMSSAYKYLTTSDDYPIFTSLMSKSNLAKHITEMLQFWHQWIKHLMYCLISKIYCAQVTKSY